MISKEVLKKVRKIEISTRGLVNDVFSGQYQSVFKGRGMDFSEVREYQFGDDIRTIDWNVTARTGHPFVKTFQEERELTVMLVVDASASGDFGTAQRMKGEIAVELCALLAFSAIKNNDKVGLIIFTDQVEKYVPPRKGRKHVLRVIRELLYHEPQNKGTDITIALEHLNRVVKRHSVVFLVSDFLTTNYERALRVANRRHDMVAIRVLDRRETEVPAMGIVEFEDSETGDRVLLDTSAAGFGKTFANLTTRLDAQREQAFRAMGVDFVQIWADRPYDVPLMKFFKDRARRFRR